MLALLIAGFGWGNPVPYDPYNLKDPKRDSLLIALAGPTSNIILAIVLAFIVRFTSFFVLIPIITINVSLAIFNLLPVPPLDGSKVLSGLLEDGKSIQFERFIAQNRNFLLIFFILPIVGGQSLASIIISPIINFILKIISIISAVPSI
jgi:Zn-dependent protease